MALKDDVERWQKSRGMGIRLGDHESDCLTNLRFTDDVLYFAGAAPENDVRLQGANCKCMIENPPRQDESSEQPQYEQKKRKWRSTTLMLRYYLRGSVRNILGKKYYISATGNS